MTAAHPIAAWFASSHRWGMTGVLVGALLFAATALPALAQSFSTGFRDFGSQNNKEPIQIEADRAEVYDEQQMAVFIGNVAVRQGDSTLKTTRLKVFYEGQAANAARATEANAQSQIKKLEAEGSVIITQADQTATGDKGTFDMKADIAVLTGNVVLTQGKNVGRGNKLTVNLKTGQAKLEGGRVQFLLMPGSEPPPAGNKKPPPAKTN
jgi:lipopolysaccharide export system protein LptA